MANEKKTKAANYIVGVFVLVFFIIGVASTVSLIAGRVRKASDNGAKLREYESFIYPVVMNDPDTFDDVSKAQQSQLIAISIWSILQSNLDTDKYSYSDKGMLIPKKDVEEAFQRLFGADVKVNHTSAASNSITAKKRDSTLSPLRESLRFTRRASLTQRKRTISSPFLSAIFRATIGSRTKTATS